MKLATISSFSGQTENNFVCLTAAKFNQKTFGTFLNGGDRSSNNNNNKSKKSIIACGQSTTITGSKMIRNHSTTNGNECALMKDTTDKKISIGATSSISSERSDIVDYKYHLIIFLIVIILFVIWAIVFFSFITRL
uniref:Uncharacterized protein n=1 Tax=Romanomermis culicivorax TaxID=13658 RepID=A0A915J7E1_ROMCU